MWLLGEVGHGDEWVTEKAIECATEYEPNLTSMLDTVEAKRLLVIVTHRPRVIVLD